MGGQYRSKEVQGVQRVQRYRGTEVQHTVDGKAEYMRSAQRMGRLNAQRGRRTRKNSQQKIFFDKNIEKFPKRMERQFSQMTREVGSPNDRPRAKSVSERPCCCRCAHEPLNLYI